MLLHRLIALAFAWFACGIVCTIAGQKLYERFDTTPRLLGTTTVYTLPCEPKSPAINRPLAETRI